jgi:hypothetical protein
MMDIARVAAFRALVLWILRLAHATDGRPAYVRQKAHQGRPCLPVKRLRDSLAFGALTAARGDRKITSVRGRLTMPRTHGALGVFTLARHTSDAVGNSRELTTRVAACMAWPEATS